jgi:tol-pal system protein YbgF
MRCVTLLAVAAALLVPSLAHAQDVNTLDRRVNKLEQEMRAVQRQVFPGGNKRFFEPENPPPGQAPAATPAPAPSGPSPTAVLQTRVDALEKQLAEITGQVEQANFKTRQLEEQLTRLKQDMDFRFQQVEAGKAWAATAAPAGAAPTPAPATAAQATPVAPATTAAAKTPSVEAEYNAAIALYQGKEFTKAEAAFRSFVAKNPNHPRASNGQYWLGQSFFQQKEFAQAARAFLEGYQKFPKGERAPDSLLGLGRSLIELNKPADACSAFSELATAYPTMNANVRAALTRERTRAKCP